MIWNRKIPAGALQFVLFIGVVIAILLLSFVLVSHTHGHFQKKTDSTIEVIRAADLALQKSFSETVEKGQTKNISLDNLLGIETEVSSTLWGLLELRKVKAKKASYTFEKLAFTGHSDDQRPALYLKDNQRPLVLAGRTRIQGTAYLPERGVKMGNIHGNSYSAPQLIYGEKKQSQGELPQLSKNIKGQMDLLSKTSFVPHGEVIRLKRDMVLKNSFKEGTKVIQGDIIELGNITLKGNIIVRASHSIRVKASSNLRDILLLAPTIQIEDRTKGSFQAVANTSIRIGKGAELAYPTVLALKTVGHDDARNQSPEPNILLDSNAQVRGIVLYEDTSEPNRFKPHIKIEEHAKVYGEVYSTQNVELIGSIYGSLTTAGFVAVENGNIYQNHIYNGRINSGLLPMEYAGLTYQNTVSNQVAKWVY